MHPPDVKADALKLVAAGYNDCEVSRITGIPRATVRDWRQPTYQRKTPEAHCHRCWGSARAMRFTSDDYAALLGLYLCDGHIAIHPRAQRLRIFLDAKYPRIVHDTAALLDRCFAGCTVGVQDAHGGTMKIPYVYSKHLACVLPQHGPGRKHERMIDLESWQVAHLDAAPWSFVKACIRSDGCCFVNRTDVHRDRPYEYVSYAFSNMSYDIVDLFVRCCSHVGVVTRVNRDRRGRWDVRDQSTSQRWPDAGARREEDVTR